MSNYTPEFHPPSIRQGHERSGTSQSPLTVIDQTTISAPPVNVPCFSERSPEMPLWRREEEKALSVTSPQLRNALPPASRCTSLSSASNLTAHRATITLSADLMEVNIKREASSNRFSPGIRKPITRFTAAARRNMLKKLAKLRDAKTGYFVTLTYGSQFDFSPEDCKRHLANLRKALTRKFKEHGAFWRIELKRRKTGRDQGKVVPHFHLLIYGIRDEQLDTVREFIHWTWTRVVYGRVVPFAPLRTNVQQMRSRRHAASYASKYAAKEDELEVDEETGELIETSYQYGRRWGTWGQLDFSPFVVISCDPANVVNMRRTVAAWLKARGSGYAKKMKRGHSSQGLSAFGMGGESCELWRNWTESTAFRVVFGI